MNERIKQLAEQSGLPTALDYHQKRYEKFAELIISECAALAKSKSEYIQSMETDDRGDQMQIQSLAWQFEEFGYKIKKHFGVEE
jgi:N-methylhydantoinase B/oxoprolinase/acetone carboxylase alpha subunit